MAEVIRFKKRANLKQISLWILGGIALVFLLWVGFDDAVPWGWRSVALATVVIGGMQVVKTA
jgi:hypothetical protein